MATKTRLAAACSLLLAFGLASCQPSGPPPDIIKTQREDLQKAKAVNDATQKAVEEQRKQVDEATK
ncbi:MAG TPA: hypothetical protein VIF60_13915 [Burkholderiaceae bacterium]